MSTIVGTITKMWCESSKCGKEFSEEAYFEAGGCCPFCGNEDISWDSPDAMEFDDDVSEEQIEYWLSEAGDEA